MPESRVHYGGDESLERRVDALESGDAWDGAATGRVLTSGDPPTWEESAGGGGSANAGDRAKLIASSFDDEVNFSYVLELVDPQPNDADVPSGWTVADGGLVLPAGVYWVACYVVATPTGPGTFNFEVNFESEWNANDAWAVGGGGVSAGSGGGKGDSTVTVEVDVNASVWAKGIVATASAGTLRVFPGGQLSSATSPSVQLWVTRVA